MLKKIVVALSLTTLLASSATGAFHDASEALGVSGGSQIAFADYNNDGWVDLFNGRIYRNEKGKRFVNIEETAKIGGGEGIWGDADNDGDMDLFIFAGSVGLCLNQGNDVFSRLEFPKLPMAESRGAVWADMNHDGLIDLYLGGYEAWEKEVYPDAAYINLGDGVFREQWQSPSNARYSARGVTAADFDEDGDTDIYVSNYRLQPNFLRLNDGTFALEDVGVEYGVAGIPDQIIQYTGGISYPICGHSIGSAFGDLDNDGHIDLLAGNFSHPSENQDRPQFLRNMGPEGNFHFEDKSGTAGLAWQESFASPTLGDFDNDGDLDLFYTTVYGHNYPVLYQNEGDWHFTDITEESGLSKLGPTYQAAWADIDNDGDLDLCTAEKIFINDNTSGNWLKIRLLGDGEMVNHSAIGSQVRIRLGDTVYTREVESGTGEGNQNDPTLHFGFGAYNGPVTLEISWLGGYKQTTANVKINRHILVRFNRYLTRK